MPGVVIGVGIQKRQVHLLCFFLWLPISMPKRETPLWLARLLLEGLYPHVGEEENAQILFGGLLCPSRYYFSLTSVLTFG